MHAHQFQSGRNLSGENRLIFLSPPTPSSGPERRNWPVVDFVNGLFERGVKFIDESLLNRDPARRRETQANLSNPRLWLEAYRDPNIFRGAPLPRASLDEGDAPTPERVLKTMTEQQRMAEFYHFVKSILPRETMVGHPEFANPAFLGDVDSLMAAGPLTLPNDATRETILETVAVILGIGAATPGARATNLAREAYRKIYPPTHPGHIYEEYKDVVDRIRALGTSLTDAQLRSRDFLIQQLSRMTPCRFLGWLRAEDPVICQKQLTELSAMRERHEVLQGPAKLKAEMDRERLIKPRVNAEISNAANSISKNLSAIYNENPALFFGIVGIGAYALWRMWKSDWKILNIIPPVLVGWYLYERVVKGNRNATDAVFGTIGGWAGTAGSRIGSFARRGGVLPPTIDQIERDRMVLIGRVFNTLARESEYAPAVIPMMATAEVKFRYFAGEAFKVDPSGAIRFRVRARPGDALYSDAQRVCTERGYDPSTLRDLFDNRTINEKIGAGLAAIFYNHVAKRPENQVKRNRVEKARRDSARIAGGPNLSYANITDRLAKADYLTLVELGRTELIREHGDASCVDLYGELMAAAPEQPERMDNAQDTPVPGTGTNMTRGAERTLYDAREEPLTADRNTSLNVMRAEFREWIAHCRRPEFTILDAGADKRLNEQMDNIFASGRPLPEVLLALERVKYNVMIAALARRPVTAVQVNEIFGDLPSPDRPGYIPQLFTNLARRFNNDVVTISSAFQNIDNIASVQAMLRGRLFTDVRAHAGTLKRLQEQLENHSKRFARLRNANEALEALVVNLDKATVMRLGGPEQTRAFFRRLIDSPEYRAFLDGAEKYYAQRVANDLVMAQLSEHQRTGLHRLTENPDDQFVSRRELLNLIPNNEFLLRNILGPESQPLSGMWASMAMRQILSEFNTATLDAASDAQRLEAVTKMRQIAILYLALQPLSARATAVPPALLAILGGPWVLAAGDMLDIAIRRHVRTLAQKFMTEWISHEAEVTKITEEEAKFKKVQENKRKEQEVIVSSRQKEATALQELLTKAGSGITVPGIGSFDNIDPAAAPNDDLRKQVVAFNDVINRHQTIVKDLAEATQNVTDRSTTLKPLLARSALFHVEGRDISYTMALLQMNRTMIDRNLMTGTFNVGRRGDSTLRAPEGIVLGVLFPPP